jgi:hypothetical protein
VGTVTDLATRASGSVLPRALPAWVYVRTDLPALIARLLARVSGESVGAVHVGHRLRGCPDMPASAAGRPWRGSAAHRVVERWCEACFPGRRCRQPVVDSFGKRAGLCGQPSDGGDECRWHLSADIGEDERMGRAA